MNFLVIGSSGLIGSHLVDYLIQKDHFVIGYDINKNQKIDPKFTFIQGNVDDYSLLETTIKKYKVNCVIHGGGISHPKQFVEAPNKIINANIIGTSNVFEASKIAGVEKIIYLSSAAVYGNNKQVRKLKESLTPTPNSVYGVTKVSGEYLANIYSQEHGMDIISLRIPFVYGPGRLMHDPIKYMLERAMKGENIKEDKGMDQKLEYIFVKDVVRAIFLAINNDHANGLILNIGTGYLTSTKKIVSVMKDLFPDISFDLGTGSFGYDEMPPLDLTQAKEKLSFAPYFSIDNGIKEYYNALNDKSLKLL
ncbi:NAD-dependent epimerase/dehydratase family protein [Lacicoccus qingdaonensis]|uniref:UDP-glucose 4-epimerase n=1 Tax=Lacicoccus qingdaonensis TaxID=576118 RepID=A0A1G9JAB1_9BACL|nr:NAD(P)-dependent oxidoreductase [Salinicoccus qingdaonensis]SDL34418.1 UDP-glucose 4-epimerase [Salinicoccus qingdaonensis]